MGAEGNTGGRSILDEKKKKKGGEKMQNVTTIYELKILAGPNSLFFFFFLPEDLIVSKANERFENDLLLLNFLKTIVYCQFKILIFLSSFYNLIQAIK